MGVKGKGEGVGRYIYTHRHPRTAIAARVASATASRWASRPALAVRATTRAFWKEFIVFFKKKKKIRNTEEGASREISLCCSHNTNDRIGGASNGYRLIDLSAVMNSGFTLYLFILEKQGPGSLFLWVEDPRRAGLARECAAQLGIDRGGNGRRDGLAGAVRGAGERSEPHDATQRSARKPPRSLGPQHSLFLKNVYIFFKKNSRGNDTSTSAPQAKLLAWVLGIEKGSLTGST
jgi:hypothetical protein